MVLVTGKMKVRQINFKENRILQYTLIFILLWGFVFMPFYLRGLSTIWEIDGVGQYYPGFLYVGQYIREFFLTGKVTSFDLRIALGEDVFSSLNYYGLGDPLNLIAVFSNKSNGAFLFAFMFFLRLYLAGLSFMLYVGYMKLDNKLAVAGAFMYMCSGYVFAACLMYIEYLSPLIYFPLLLWSCEKFFKEGKWWWMALVSAYAALCTVYLFYYAALFLVPYALVRAWFIYKKNIKKIIIECLLCGCSCVTGVAITFPVLVPVLEGILNSERAGADVLGTLVKKTYYRPTADNIVRLFKGFLPAYENGEFFFHEIPVIAYVAILVLVFTFALKKQRSTRNIQLLIATVLGCGLYTIRITNIIFSGFVEGSNYDRWIFMLEFVFAVCFMSIASDYIKDKFMNDEKKAKLAYTAVSSIVIVNVAVIGFLFYSVAGKEFRDEFLPYKDVKQYVDSPVNYSAVIGSDKDLYRISNDSLTNVNGRPENVQMINDYNGLTFWLSVINPNSQKIADLNSEEFSDYRMFGLKNDRVLESLAAVKYYLRHDNEKIPEGYELKESVDFYGEKWEVYENPYALPLCYGFSEQFYRENLKAQDESVLEAAIMADNISYYNDTITCSINMPEDGVVILAIPYTEGFSVTIDNTPAKIYNSNIYYMAVDIARGEHSLVYKYSAY